MFTCDDERTCDECYASGKFVGRKGNVVYCDNGSRPLCKTCNGIPSDEDIINALRTELAAWKYSAEQFSRNEDYYRGLVVAIGEMFGIEAKTSDDGSVQEDVLCAKVPELVAALRAEVAILRDMLDAAVERQCKCGED